MKKNRPKQGTTFVGILTYELIIGEIQNILEAALVFRGDQNYKKHVEEINWNVIKKIIRYLAESPAVRSTLPDFLKGEKEKIHEDRNET